MTSRDLNAYLQSLLVGESQQPTHTSEPLSASVGAPLETPHGAALRPGTRAVPTAGPNVPRQTGTQEGEPERAPETSHAPPDRGHCHQDTQLGDPTRSTTEPDVSCDHATMDMLNKFEKKSASGDESFTDSLPYTRQPANGHEGYLEAYDTVLNHFSPLNDPSVSGEAEDPSSTRHSSGCDDSGVFLEDLPYTAEHTTANNKLSLPDRLTSDSKTRKVLSPDMRQYSIDNQGGLDSDAEKSDDLGLASSSIDSADDLDGDPLPSTLKTEYSPVTSKKKPPPVPTRKSISNSRCYDSKDNVTILTLQTNLTLPSQNTTKTFTEINSLFESLNSAPTEQRRHSCQPESYKWKSEECLRSAIESKWSLRSNEKAISVKDRIAMFSVMESNTNTNKTEDLTLQRYGSETNVKTAPSVETIDRKCEIGQSNNSRSDDFPSLSRDTKWYSMYSIPPTTTATTPTTERNAQNLKSAASIPSLSSATLPDNIDINSSINPLKVETEHRYFEKPIVSNYPQTQLTNSKRYNYGLYNLKPIRTTEDLLAKKNNGGGLLSIIDPRKQPLAKLKGLVIPDKPLQSPTSKALPTIVSNDSLISTTKTDIDIDKDWKRSPLTMTAASCKTMSLPRTKNELRAKLEQNSEREVSAAKLVEPPWRLNVSNNSTLPKYSPAFKRRTLELPHALGSSLSPTPPSSITSPLSPPPSSPSSICSSNASSTATMQQNIFQFSLSHSKPVTPVLPEKPIMSPPSLPSDIEYEGDNSEDSSTSASPMISSHDSAKLISPSRNQPTISSSLILNPDGLRYAKAAELLPSVTYQPLPVETIYKSSYHMRSNNNNDISNNRDEHSSTNINLHMVKNPMESHSIVSTANIRAATGKSFQSRDLLARQQFSPYVKDLFDTDMQFNEQFLTSMQKNSRDYQSTEDSINTSIVMRKNSVNSAYSSSEASEASSGNKNGFSDASQEVPLGKFRAQPLKLNQSEKNSLDNNNAASQPHVAKALNNNGYSNKFHSEQNVFDTSTDRQTNGNSLTEANGNVCSSSDYGYGQGKQWLQSSDLIRYEKKVDSEDEDDSHSSFSHQTEDSRHTTDDYLSDTTTDSYDKSIDPDLKPRRLSQQRTVLKAAMDGTDSVQKFRALAEKWEQRTDVKSPPPPPPPINPIPVRAKKESRSGSASAITSSSFITSIINSTTNAVPSASLKLPPSLMPRNSPLEIRPSERKSRVSPSSKVSNHRSGRDQVHPSTLGNSEKDIKNIYEAVWSNNTSNYNGKSNLNGMKDTTHPIPNNDTVSNYSAKCNVKNDVDISPEYNERTLQHSKRNKVDDDQLSNSGLPDYDIKSISKTDNDVFEITSGDDIPSYTTKGSSREALDNTCDVPVSNCTKSKSVKRDLGTTDNALKDEPPTYSRISTDTEWKSENTSSVCQAKRRFSTENKDLLDNTWNDGPTDTYFRRNSAKDRADFLVSRNLSKSQVSLHSSTRDPLESVRSRSGSYFSSNKSKSISVSDIRKAFETQCNQNNPNLRSKPPPVPATRQTTTENGTQKQQNGIHTKPSAITNHNRLSSLDSTASGDSDPVSPTRYGSVGSLTSISRDPYGSVTSLASTTSLISPQELQQLIEEANQSLEESCGGKYLQQQEIQVVVLHREVPAGSIGITLAGGADYEVKEITVHKVISGSLADRDGRIRKGDRVISINGRHLRGLSHREALDILKAPRPEVVLVISRDKVEVTNNGYEIRKTNREAELVRTNDNSFSRKSDDAGIMANNSNQDIANSQVVNVELQRDSTGLGFSIEGGKDSPLGDRPLLIKRIFKGGVADKDGQLEVGDEIISVNGQSVTSMTRTEAWNFLKKLPEEPIILVARKTPLCSS